MQPLSQKLESYNLLLDERLRRLLRGAPPFERFYQIMAYHFGWLDRHMAPSAAAPGKRLRPALCFLVCEALGVEPVRVLPGAVAVELVHNFSLVHDDIQDRSHLRRHRETVWSIWGIPQGINVGDGLFAIAQLALLEDDGHAKSDVARAALLLNRTCVALCEGQFLDLDLQDSTDVTRDHYMAMVQGKTAALFQCAAELGALLAAADDETIELFGRFGRSLGLAFQMQDDLMGVWGEKSETGKPAADVLSRKRALPVVIAWERAAGADSERLRYLYTRSEPLTDEEAEWVVDLFERLDLRQEVARMAHEEFKRAEQLLCAAASRGAQTTYLHEFVRQIAERSW